MSEATILEYDFVLRKNCNLVKLKQEAENAEKEWGVILDRFNDIELDEYYLPQSLIDDMIVWIAKYYDGVICLKNDWDEYWKVIIDQGKRKEINGRVIYGNIIDAVIQECDLPDKIKKDLEKFKILKEV